MRFLGATLLGLHAAAHVLGFVWPWWADPLPSGGSHVGAQLFDDATMRGVSLLWLATGMAFWFGSVASFAGTRTWRPIVAAAASASLVLSIVCAPASLPGVPVNLAIIALLWLTAPGRRPRVPWGGRGGIPHASSAVPR